MYTKQGCSKLFAINIYVSDNRLKQTEAILSSIAIDVHEGIATKTKLKVKEHNQTRISNTEPVYLKNKWIKIDSRIIMSMLAKDTDIREQFTQVISEM